jgi:hypothetical protein
MINEIKDLLQKIEATLDEAALREVEEMGEKLIISFTRERKIGAAFVLRYLLRFFEARKGKE